jgi:nitroreductase
MQVSHAIRERRSVRAFLPDPVPAEVVRHLLDLARWAPSWGNSQDWNAYVVEGATLEVMKAAFQQLAEEDAPSAADLPRPPQEWPAYLASRMNVPRPSAESPGGSAAVIGDGPRPFALWGAPTLVLFAIDADLEPTYACFDAGLIVQTLCLAAEDRGFSTCIMALAVRYADILHELIPIAAGQRFVIGVALGQADHNAVINRGDRRRVEVEEWATFVNDIAEEPASSAQ